MYLIYSEIPVSREQKQNLMTIFQVLGKVFIPLLRVTGFAALNLPAHDVISL